VGELNLYQEINEALFFIGRQPIFNRNREVFAYELLYRSSQENCAHITDGDQATSNILTNTFSKAGLNTLVGNKKAFINMTRSFLLSNYPALLPPARTVIEILEDTKVDDRLGETLSKLNFLGYQFALDDVTSLNDKVSSLSCHLSFAKVDIINTPAQDLHFIVDNLKENHFRLIAEKVETYEEYQMCKKLGFDFFQGFFFCRPEVVSMRKFETSRQVMVQTLARLQNPNVRLEDLEQIVSMDVTLGYRLLKLVNSGYYSLPVTITSIRHAISMIGLDQLRNWLSLFLMSNINHKPHELCNQALIRAKAAEKFAEALSYINHEAYFLAGLFSILNALLDMSINEIVEGINLSDEVALALLERKGTIGNILQVVEGIETGNWDLVLKTGLGIEKISSIYMDAIRSTELLRKAVYGKPVSAN
jgi:c-di-GMP phosphodiesterase